MDARTTDSRRESRLRRRAMHQSLTLRKSRTQDSSDDGVYYLIDPSNNTLVATCQTLDQVENWLNQ